MAQKLEFIEANKLLVRVIKRYKINYLFTYFSFLSSSRPHDKDESMEQTPRCLLDQRITRSWLCHLLGAPHDWTKTTLHSQVSTYIPQAVSRQLVQPKPIVPNVQDSLNNRRRVPPTTLIKYKRQQQQHDDSIFFLLCITFIYEEHLFCFYFYTSW